MIIIIVYGDNYDSAKKLDQLEGVGQQRLVV